jgi:SAM-dependent MidA family methyltransferase
MLRLCRVLRAVKTRTLFTSTVRLNQDPKKSQSTDDALYFGKFTKEEYDEAANYIKQQIARLEQDIKGDTNVREKLGKVPQFPQRDLPGSTNINNLTDLFTQTIKTTGPISLSSYMRQCLTHPDFGYYTTRDPLHVASGDFITSPEISSVFGEMIGIWLFTVWKEQKCPQKFRLIEFGPGKGSLMFDTLQTFNKLAKNSNIDIEINLIEASSVLRREQWKLLCGENKFKDENDGHNSSITKWNNVIRWHNTEKDIAQDDTVANYTVAHEFFDALPIKSFEKMKNGWREYVVEHTPSVMNTQGKLPGDVVEDTNNLETEFHLTLSPKETPSSMIPKLNPRFSNLPEGSRIEICPDAELYMMKMVQLINNKSKLGGVLIIDYGIVSDVPPENSLRGIYKHKFVSPFFKPGDVDLSIDVDFIGLKKLAERFCQPFGPVEQGDWLHNMGIGYRIQQLLDKNQANPEEQDKIYHAYKRLTDKDEKSMGKIYKFFCLLPSDSATPTGFNNCE